MYMTAGDFGLETRRQVQNEYFNNQFYDKRR